MRNIRFLVVLALVCAGTGVSRPLLADSSKSVRVKGVVTTAAPSFLVVGDPSHLDRAGEYVALFNEKGQRCEGPEGFRPGDRVIVTGWRGRVNGQLVHHAQVVARNGTMALPSAAEAKHADIRNGRLNLRRVKLTGVLRDQDDGYVTIVHEHTATSVHVHSRAPCPEKLTLGSQIAATGVIRDIFDESGTLTGSQLEVADWNDIELLGWSSEKVLHAVYVCLAVLAAVVLLALVCLLLRMHHRQVILKAVIAERRRLAAELHEDLEQYLAGALIYLSPMHAEGVDPKMAKVVEHSERAILQTKERLGQAIAKLRGEEQA